LEFNLFGALFLILGFEKRKISICVSYKKSKDIDKLKIFFENYVVLKVYKYVKGACDGGVE
jgi:hypothetical protein